MGTPTSSQTKAKVPFPSAKRQMVGVQTLMSAAVILEASRVILMYIGQKPDLPMA